MSAEHERHDYLWDKTGEPDPEVQRLEKLLSRYRHNQPQPHWLAPVSRFPWRWLAAAAAVLALLGGVVWLVRGPEDSRWEVVRVEGAPQVGTKTITEKAPLPASEWLQTNAASRARLQSRIGEVEVEPNTRLRLLRARTAEHRLELPRGTIHAVIWAPPRRFFVETPAAVAIDLGCSYTLTVDDAGAGSLEVTSGWVAFELAGRESFIPAGALCATRPAVGPGTPYFTDAPAEFKQALAQLDFDDLTRDQRAAALGVALTEARARDAFSLWHLLARVREEERGAVYDRLAWLVPPPAGVTRQGVLRGDRQMLDRWWDALGHARADWFRLWKGSWPPSAP